MARTVGLHRCLKARRSLREVLAFLFSYYDECVGVTPILFGFMFKLRGRMLVKFRIIICYVLESMSEDTSTSSPPQVFIHPVLSRSGPRFFRGTGCLPAVQPATPVVKFSLSAGSFVHT